MPFPIENKLVIAVASSALFDLTESDCIFREKGETVYLDARLPHGVRLAPGCEYASALVVYK